MNISEFKNKLKVYQDLLDRQAEERQEYDEIRRMLWRKLDYISDVLEVGDEYEVDGERYTDDGLEMTVYSCNGWREETQTVVMGYEWFINWDEQFAQHKERKKELDRAQREEYAKKQRELADEKERKEYERLREKFGKLS